jgi:pimeloyl-ACP methyl ester carboxylesterase
MSNTTSPTGASNIKSTVIDPEIKFVEGRTGRLAYKARAGRSPTVVFLPGFKSDMEGSKAVALDQWARRRGQSFLRLDYAGHGNSDGAFDDGTISSWSEDALTVIDHAAPGPVVLVGSSMGGWIMLRVALARGDRIAGLVGIAAAPDFTEDLIWAELDDDQRDALRRQTYLDMPSEYSEDPTRVTLKLIDDGRQNLLLGGPIDIRAPARLVHGLADPDVPWQISLKIAEQMVGDDVEICFVKSGDHRLSRAQDIETITKAVRSVCDLHSHGG